MREKLYYKDPYLTEFDAAVLSCEENNGKFLVELDDSAFYPEGGGQPADRGSIGEARVTDVHEKDGRVLHTCDRPAAPGSTVHCVIDWERRFDHMQQHSGEHIVSGMLCSTFNCDNIGFHMGAEVIQIDYNANITWEQVLEIEERANRYIAENHEFVELWPDEKERETLEYRSKKALTGEVRIASFPSADMCACCGTHVRSSAEVGLVKMLSVQKIKEGVRIEMLSGKRAFDYLAKTWEQNQAVSRELSAKPMETHAAVLRQKEEIFKLKSALVSLQNELFEGYIEKYAGAVDPVLIVPALSPDGVRELCDKLSQKAGGRCCVFAGEDGNYKYSVVYKDHDIRDFIKMLNSELNGRGGGRDGFAQGSAECTKEQIISFFNG